MDKLFYLSIVLIGFALLLGIIKSRQLQKRINRQEQILIEIKETIGNMKNG